MSAPAAKLARPLAVRVASLPPVPTPDDQPLPLDEGVIDAALGALTAGKTHYTDRPGILPLRERVSTHLRALGFDIKPDAITITCGVEEARFAALRQWAAGAGIFTANPSALAGVTSLIGAHFTATPDDAAVISVDSEAALQSALESLSAQATGWLVWHLNDADTPEASQSAAQGVEARGLTPRLLLIGDLPGMTGWRVGFMAGSSAAGKLRAFKQSMTICSPSISQWAALGVAEPKQW